MRSPGWRLTLPLGARDIHQHAKATTDRIARLARVLDHRAPGVGVVMGAVDADDIGAAPRNLQHVARVVRCLCRQRHQNAARTLIGGATQQGICVCQ
jgi:hypothetical protein